MADSVVRVPQGTESTDALIDNERYSVGGNAVDRQKVALYQNAAGTPILVTANGTLTLDAATLAALETISVANMIPAVETGLAKEATLGSILTELGQKLEAGQAVALDTATLAALETINVLGPLTDTQLRATPVPVDITDASITIAEPVSVDDNGGSLTVDGPVTNTELRAAPVPTRARTGTPDYDAGSSGTVTVPATAVLDEVEGHVAIGGAGTLVVNGGAPIPLGAGQSFGWTPRSEWVAPSLVFSGTDRFFVTWLVP